MEEILIQLSTAYFQCIEDTLSAKKNQLKHKVNNLINIQNKL